MQDVADYGPFRDPVSDDWNVGCSGATHGACCHGFDVRLQTWSGLPLATQLLAVEKLFLPPVPELVATDVVLHVPLSDGPGARHGVGHRPSTVSRVTSENTTRMRAVKCAFPSC